MIILASRAQHHVDRAFRQMKNPHWVSFSPAFHWTDQKLLVYAFYFVLGLLLSSVLQRKAAPGGMKLTRMKKVTRYGKSIYAQADCHNRR